MKFQFNYNTHNAVPDTLATGETVDIDINI